MVRLVSFLVLTLVLASLLGHVPVVGPIFARTGCFGIWIVAIGLGFAMTRLGELAVRRGRGRTEVRRLEAVGGPVNLGKAGALLLAQGRVGAALPYLAAAAEGEPQRAEWHYRHGVALLGRRRIDEAITALRRTVELDEEHAYGGAQMRLAEALARRGDLEDALAALDTFERNHGPSPESAFRRGRALRAAGRRGEAAAAFREVGELARNAARYQQREAMTWSLRAALVRWL